jgi:flagellar L-ring protein FlgH
MSMRYLPVLFVAALAAGCSTFTRPEVEFKGPMTALPKPPAEVQQSNGAIYQANAGTYRPLFEDRRARYIGDTLIIQINEKTQANTKQDSSADRTASASAKLPAIKIPGSSKTLAALDASASSDSAFEGKGGASTDNVFTGTITVTVVDVLSNGNLMVAGEKQVGIGQNMETLRFSGVVNPTTVLNGNTVNSTQVADARIQTRAHGYIDQAQTMGWLQRCFLSFWPF